MNDDTRILVSRLAGTPEWDALEEHLNEARTKIIERLLAGLSTYDDYLRACGEVKGLDAVLTAPRIPESKRPASLTTTNSRH